MFLLASAVQTSETALLPKCMFIEFLCVNVTSLGVNGASDDTFREVPTDASASSEGISGSPFVLANRMLPWVCFCFEAKMHMD